MIVVRIVGGLGNQMFQYAAGRALSLRLGVPLKIDLSAYESYTLRTYGLSHFDISAEVADMGERVEGNSLSLMGRIRRRLGLGTHLAIYREKGLEFDPLMLRLADGTYLDGYWQSERYFKDIADRIRKDFTIRSAPSEQNEFTLKQIMSTEAVSIHIRRGDYISDSKTNSVHGVCELGYYQSAMDLIARQLSQPPHVFVFSDDPVWVHKNLNLKHPMTFITHNDANSHYEDLRLMSACKHHIIANSSFSWWGAWLNPSPKKLVVAPKRWFKNQKLSDRDIVPTGWTRL